MTTVETSPSMMAELFVQHEVEQWLYREAALLDARDYDSWLGLLSPDIHYFMPLRENRLDRDVSRDKKGTGLETALFDDDYRFLRRRVRRINTGMAWNEEPPPRTRRLITNVMVTPETSEAPDASEARPGGFVVTSNFFIKRNRLHDDEDEFAGARSDVLVRGEDGRLILLERTVHLDQSVILTKSFSLIF
jgi:3-phenylpropionate/cinnamic acid dioxygenase small subunit